MSWDQFVIFAIVALLCWGIGAVAAWRGKRQWMVYTATLAGLAVFFAFILGMWINWNAEAAEKGGFEHFMLKEIYEQPKSIRDTMTGRVPKDSHGIEFTELGWTEEEMAGINKIFIVACGTAYHAGIVGKYYLEQLARIPVEVDIASEFRYRSPLVDGNSLTIVISQSGETSDTLAALKEAKRLGSRTLAVTNVVGSSISREADRSGGNRSDW